MRRKLMLIAAIVLLISAIIIFGNQILPDPFRLWEGGGDYIEDGGGGFIATAERFANSEIKEDVIQANDAFVKLGKDLFGVAISIVSDIEARVRENLNRPILPPLPEMNLSTISISARDALSS